MTPDLIDAWWDATRDRRLLVQRCSACATYQHHPRPLCLSCGSTDLRFDEATRGRLVSFTEVHRAPSPDGGVPYTVALVELHPGAVLLARLLDHDLDPTACDSWVELADWVELDDGRALPAFRRSRTPGA